MYVRLMLPVIKGGFMHSEDLGFDGRRFLCSQKQLVSFKD